MPPWNNCGCSTVYTDAWGRVINGPNSGADGATPTTATASPCDLNYVLLGLLGVAALVGMTMAHGGKL